MLLMLLFFFFRSLALVIHYTNAIQWNKLKRQEVTDKNKNKNNIQKKVG